jgi:hypothetical protein
MKIPPNVYSNIVDSILTKYKIMFKPFGVLTKKEVETALDEHLALPFNSEYDINFDMFPSFKNFFISITIHQICSNMHPLTCGVSSSHHNLVPRVSTNKENFLVCPSCGYVQNNPPMIF